ncbi:hypothetical protein BDZ97DRAFT_1807180, partial [Flammula alnicola]
MFQSSSFAGEGVSKWRCGHYVCILDMDVLGLIWELCLDILPRRQSKSGRYYMWSGYANISSFRIS